MDDTMILDVRPLHERGEEPFTAIMDAVGRLGERQSLLLINSFEPVPLYAVMQRRGFTHRCAVEGPDEYHVIFSRT
ncbi:MAG: DUF2249 domain-containing protein [Vulcanimicrobiaceae bacterium]